MTAAPAPEVTGAATAEDEEPRGEVGLLPADPAARPGLDAGDISLALRYLAETRVVVFAEPLAEAAVAAAIEGAAFAVARLVVVVPAGATPPSLPPEATVLEAPAEDDGSFGRVVGTFAAGLDAGTEPRSHLPRRSRPPAGAGLRLTDPRQHSRPPPAPRRTPCFL